MKEILLKEYEPQDARGRLFVSLKRLNEVFSARKERKLHVYDMCML